MQLETKKFYYTPEEYLEIEQKAEYKSEYRDGEIVSKSILQKITKIKIIRNDVCGFANIICNSHAVVQ